MHVREGDVMRGSLDKGRNPKHTFFYVTVQEYNHKNHHFLVPRLSDQADNDPVQVSLSDFEHVDVDTDPTRLKNDDLGRLTSTFRFSDERKRTDTKAQREQLSACDRDSTSPQSVSVGISAAMRPSGFGEGLSLTDLPPSRDTSVATFCDFHVDARYKSSVEIGPGQCPAWFQSKIVCHGTTTKKNFRTSVDYLPKMKPLKFAQTHFVRPKRLEMTYVSYYDYNSSDNERWFTASVQLVPRSNSSNTVRSYLMKPPKQTGPRRSEVTIVNGRASEVRGDSDDDDDNSSHDGERDSDIEQQLSLGGDINTNIVNKSTTVGGQPSGAVLSPLLMSSGPEDDDEQRFGSTRLSHRTKMVLDTAPSHRDMDGDDYVLYLQGYASTGDDTNKTVNGYHWKIDHVDGYLSEESV